MLNWIVPQIAFGTICPRAWWHWGRFSMDSGGLKATFGMIWCLWSSFGEDFGDERHQDHIFGRQEHENKRKMNQLGRVWKHLGGILNRLRGFLGGSWSVQRVPGGCLGRSFRSLEGIPRGHCIFSRFYHDFFEFPIVAIFENIEKTLVFTRFFQCSEG